MNVTLLFRKYQLPSFSWNHNFRKRTTLWCHKELWRLHQVSAINPTRCVFHPQRTFLIFQTSIGLDKEKSRVLRRFKACGKGALWWKTWNQKQQIQIPLLDSTKKDWIWMAFPGVSHPNKSFLHFTFSLTFFIFFKQQSVLAGRHLHFSVSIIYQVI